MPKPFSVLTGVSDEAALRRRLKELQADDPALAKVTKEAGLDLDTLMALYRKQLRAGFNFTPEELLRFAIKQHRLPSTRPPAV